MTSSELSRYRQTQASYTSLADFVTPTPGVALRHAQPGHEDITHQALHDFIRGFTLPVRNAGLLPKPIVAVILPNGPILAAAVLAVTNVYAAAPINPAAGPEQIAADIELSGASAILSCASETEKLGLSQLGLDVFHVEQCEDGVIRVQTSDGGIISGLPAAEPNTGNDIGIILFTSGTSGKKKVVPMTTHSIVCGVGFVIESWALRQDDICLNMMPLYHVGGLIRNIFAPIHAGGSTICCPGFDPNQFWDSMESVRPTWYYASPSMHSLILEESKNRPQALEISRMRLICNAAGGLLPALAIQLRDTFSATVLPSYGMTECMPISTPPIDYKLDRSGTSGISVGPDLTVLDGNDKYAAPMAVGRICVRGEPVFKGYLQADGTLDTSPFNEEGWFDTGDMGYMDEDGYLYITGRNKEVINRGGELISPFEVENAIVLAAEREDSPIFGRVSQALAFSVQHQVLQEVVGVILVTPKGKPRADARLLHEALRSTLQQAKWPVFIVYMDDVPKKNNKVLRIKLGERLGLPTINDDTPFAERHWEAVCPPENTELSVRIRAKMCHVDEKRLREAVSSFLAPGTDVWFEKSASMGTLELFLAPPSGAATPISVDTAHLSTRLSGMIDGYLLPHRFQTLNSPLPRDEKGGVDSGLLHNILKDMQAESAQLLSSSTEGRVTQIFGEVLGLDPVDIAPHKDFFSLGGDSLRAGKLLSALRLEFKLRLPIDLIFNDGSVEHLAEFINKELLAMEAEQEAAAENGELGGQSQNLPGCEETHSSTNPLLLLVQLIPMLIVYPLRRSLQWTFFMYALMYSEGLSTSNTTWGRLLNLIVCIYLARTVAKLALPWFGIAAKWLLIGRHKPGLYPMWGGYHTRWWLAQKIVDVCGKGFFKWSDGLSITYYRLLGAKIGSGVTIKNAQLGEWDMLDIGDNVTLDGCVVRPMAGERNTSMLLAPITIGRNSSIGVASTVAPGSDIPDNTCIGPNSSSWEMSDASEANRDLSATKAPSPHWVMTIFFTVPLSFLGGIVYISPWALGLIGLVQQAAQPMRSRLVTILNWFALGERVGWHYLARALRTFFGPFFLFAFVVVLRWTLDAIFGPLPRDPADLKDIASSSAHNQSQVTKWRMALMKALLPVPQLHEMTGLFGQHYEATSVAIRMLGGRAGKRIYWPGTGPSIGDYHLIDVGDDVVFGSRSHLITSDGTGSGKVTIEDRSMIADRVVLLPGVTIERGTTMGSGALTRRDKTYDAGGTYVGSRGGDSVCLVKGNAASAAATAAAEEEAAVAQQFNQKQQQSRLLMAGGRGGPMTSVQTFAQYPDSLDGQNPFESSLSVNRGSTRGSTDFRNSSPVPVPGAGPYLRPTSHASTVQLPTDPNTLTSPSPEPWDPTSSRHNLMMSHPVDRSALSNQLNMLPPDSLRRHVRRARAGSGAGGSWSSGIVMVDQPRHKHMSMSSIVDPSAEKTPHHPHPLSNNPYYHSSTDSDDYSSSSSSSYKKGHGRPDATSISPSQPNADPTASTPFGRAFHHGLAPYHVLGPAAIFLYCSLTTVFVEVYWNASSISSLQIVAYIYRNAKSLGDDNDFWNVFVLFGIVAGLISVLVLAQSIGALLLVIAAKWMLIGRREPGNYDWDRSSYCQRWQIFLTIEKLRRRCFGGTGVLGMLTGTAYVTWYFRALGAQIGKDCALFVNGRPSLMFTEPDLLTLGDRVVVDDASLVGHINTRGQFDLNRLKVGNRAVLRTGSRLLSGASMGDDSCLLEHTLVMAGDVVEDGETMQGWPAGKFRGKRASFSALAISEK